MHTIWWKPKNNRWTAHEKSNPPELSRETLKTLAAHKFLPMPDNHSRIYTETCGTPVKTQHGAEKAQRGIADPLAKTSKPALAKAASKKATRAKGRDECLKEEIKKSQPGQGGETAQS